MGWDGGGGRRVGWIGMSVVGDGAGDGGGGVGWVGMVVVVVQVGLGWWW